MVENLKTLKFNFSDHNIEMKIEQELNVYLASIKKENLSASLNYLIKETVGNANKANMKRIHFYLQDLNIQAETDYKTGITTFKESLSQNFQRYQEQATKLGFFIRIDFYISRGYLVLLTSNNSTILPIEKSRFLNKIDQAARFKTLEEALAKAFDESEGAGFGIILTILMLRRMGLSEKSLRLIDKKNLTQMQIAIPISLINEEESNVIALEIVNEIEDIPQFPQHIMELQKLLNDENANFTKVSGIIEKDPSLIADLLKIANSAFYMLPKKVDTIKEAVRLIGLKGIRNLVITYSTKNIMMEKYSLEAVKTIMDHSYEVAYYAYEIARILKLKDIIDDAYIGGILHDMGKIIINSLKPEFMDKIKVLCDAKGIDRNVMENLTNGYNHSIIGANLCEKWNFPDDLIDSIRYHHIPLEAIDRNFDLVAIIYIANNIYYYKQEKFDFLFFNNKVLQHFNLEDQTAFNELCQTLFKNFERQKTQLLYN